MNTTTFTIESVHGVKQTFVLSILDRSVGGQSSKDKPSPAPIPTQIATGQVAPPTNR